MTDDGEGEPSGVLVEHRLSRSGLQVKLAKGFEGGTYSVCVEFDDLAVRSGVMAARRTAGDYCTLLKSELRRSPRPPRQGRRFLATAPVQKARPGGYLAVVPRSDGRRSVSRCRREEMVPVGFLPRGAAVGSGAGLHGHAATRRWAGWVSTTASRALAGDAYTAVDAATKCGCLTRFRRWRSPREGSDHSGRSGSAPFGGFPVPCL